MKRAAALLAIAMLATAPAHAVTVLVAAFGEVTENQIVDSPLGDVAAGEGVVMSFTVDSNDFVDGASGDSRGYVISSFSLAFSGGVTVGWLIGGDTPYFTLADGMPVSDGFWVSTSPDSPAGCRWNRNRTTSTSTWAMKGTRSLRWTSSTRGVSTISTV